MHRQWNVEGAYSGKKRATLLKVRNETCTVKLICEGGHMVCSKILQSYRGMWAQQADYWPKNHMRETLRRTSSEEHIVWMGFKVLLKYSSTTSPEILEKRHSQEERKS